MASERMAFVHFVQHRSRTYSLVFAKCSVTRDLRRICQQPADVVPFFWIVCARREPIGLRQMVEYLRRTEILPTSIRYSFVVLFVHLRVSVAHTDAASWDPIPGVSCLIHVFRSYFKCMPENARISGISLPSTFVRRRWMPLCSKLRRS